MAPKYEILAVPDGQSAYPTATLRRPDLVLADLRMPSQDLGELLRDLRTDPRTASIPIIVLSPQAEEESQIENLLTEMDDYLMMPFSDRELRARVRRTLKLFQIRGEAENRVKSVFESITDGFVTLDREWRYTYVNAEAERMLNRERSSLLGRSVWELFPALSEMEAGRQLRRAISDQLACEFGGYSPTL
ncbi:MAG TPA: response regulator, partial [Blastocatellia bacterium]|nr:response regulator [Blastocatellia bacterium]